MIKPASFIFTDNWSVSPLRDLASRRYSSRYFFVLFAAELILISIIRLPESMRFDGFAFCDHGSNLSLQYLISHNYRPGFDFGYLYGLMSAAAGSIWFAIWGPNAWSYQTAMIALNLVCAWALARTYSAIKIERIGLLLTVIALGFAYQATYPNLTHALEAALIGLALSEQARGAHANALALAAVTVFVKPSMAYAYSLLLICLLVWKRGLRLRNLTLDFAPAAIAVLFVGALLSFKFGSRVVFHSVIPTQGARIYREMHFGILGAGRPLWDLSTQWPTFFLSHAGFWVVSNLFLYSAAAIEIRRVVSTGVELSRRAEVIITCAGLHLCFVLFFFGNQFCWIYYSYLLVVGCAAAVDLTEYPKPLGQVLCAVALVSWTGLAFWTYRWWRTTAPAASTRGLWATANERDDWEKVLAMSAGRKTIIVHPMGAVEMMFNGFQAPIGTYIMKGLMLQGDIDRRRTQLAEADMVVRPLTYIECGPSEEPEFNDAMASFEPIWKSANFEVLRRRTALTAKLGQTAW